MFYVDVSKFETTYFEKHLRTAASSLFQWFTTRILERSLKNITSFLTNPFRDRESLLIARDKPILNKADSSLPLELF